MSHLFNGLFDRYDCAISSQIIFQSQYFYYYLRYYINNFNSVDLIHIQNHMIKITLIAAILCLITAQHFAPKTKESVTASFNTFDVDHNGLLSKKQSKLYFDRDYLNDFKGIDIDPKFISSAYTYILNEDKNGDGLSLEQFISAIIPKPTTKVKTQPEYYREEDL